MVTFLITSFFVLAGLGIAAYFWQKPRSVAAPEQPTLLPSGRALFIDGTPHGNSLAQAQVDSELAATAAARRRELVERAQAGDNSILEKARNLEDGNLYEEALDLLVAGADSDPKLLSLVSYVTRHELAVNRNLAERFIDSYKRSPNRSSTAKVLHVAALSDLRRRSLSALSRSRVTVLARGSSHRHFRRRIASILGRRPNSGLSLPT